MRRLTIVPVVALVAVAAIGLLLVGGGDDRHQTVTAELGSANELRVGDAVRIDGVEVGKVTEVELRAGSGTALATMAVDDELRLTRDARLGLRWGTLLGGNLYVDLDLGAPSAGRDPTNRIPLARTTSQVEFDQVFQTFDGPTGPAVQTFLREIDEGLSSPAAVGGSLRALAPTLSTFREGVRPLRGREADDLRALVAGTARTVNGLGRSPERLSSLVDGAAATLAVTARRRRELGRFIALSPAALDATRTTVARIDETLVRLDPLARRLRPGARELYPAIRVTRPALRRLTALLDEARPLLRTLPRALGSLRTASRSGRALVDGLAPTLRRLDDDLLPFLGRVDPDTDRRLYEMIGPTVAVASSAGAQFDGEGNWLRFAPVAGERVALAAPCQTFFTDPSATEKARCDALEDGLRSLFSGGSP